MFEDLKWIQCLKINIVYHNGMATQVLTVTSFNDYKLMTEHRNRLLIRHENDDDKRVTLN